MTTQMETELARADLRRLPEGLESLGAHWEGLKRFVDDPRIPMDNNSSERLERGPAVARKLLRLGVALEWSTDGGVVLDLGHVGAVEAQSPEMADVVFEHCAAAGGKVPGDVQSFLPWNLSEERKKELGEPGIRRH